jgi:tRNA-specific 2-thiouridylase
VLGLEPERNRVVVGTARHLEASGLIGERLHWIGADPGSEVEAMVKIRSRHPGAVARVRSLAGGRAEVEFESPQRGVTPGQAAVIYQGSRVLGGCWITSSGSRSSARSPGSGDRARSARRPR